jgi:dihydroorotate dehydrogenase (NAD+) catalytic subunit
MEIELAPWHKRGLHLTNPVMNAAGMLGFAAEYRRLVDFGALGAFVTNALTATARTPARPPNVVELPAGVLVHTGLPNPGVGAAVRRYAREWQRLGSAGVPVIVHLAATTPSEVSRSVGRIEREEAVSGLELGLRDDVTVAEAVQLVRAALGNAPLLVQIPFGRTAELATVIAQAGADALVVSAAPRASVETGTPAIQVTGRRYSPVDFDEALAAVALAVATVPRIPVVGAGGIWAAEQARAMLTAGAAAVQVDAAAWCDPGFLARLAAELIQSVL